MLRSMFIGISGLENHQARMDVVANNISNVNTIGFKKGRVNFEDILSQTLTGAAAPVAGSVGGTNPKQIGIGMTVASIDNIFNQGSLQTTGKNTDMAIQGNGMFILNDGSINRFTRAGIFDVDSAGTLVSTATGWNVQGWQADNNGTIDTTVATGNISVPIGSTIPANATNTITYGYNLDSTTNGSVSLSSSTQTVTDSAGAGSSRITWTVTPTGSFRQFTVKGVLSAGTWGSSGTNTLQYDITTNAAGLVTASTGPGATDTIDIDGGGADVTMNIINAGATLNGALNAITPQAPDTVSANIGATYADAGTYASTVNVYDSLGATHAITLTFTKTADNTWTWTASGVGVPIGGLTPTGTLTFNNNGALTSSVIATPITVTAAPAANIAPNPDFTAVTQYAAPDTLIAQSQDGFTSGALLSFNVNNSGVITGTYSNGLNRDLAQVAMAHFTNYGGLLKEGSDMYSETANSGIAFVGTANTGGRGQISAGTLEMSNVDLAEEFTQMITAQRGFQANSRSITTSDEMLQELLTLKR